MSPQSVCRGACSVELRAVDRASGPSKQRHARERTQARNTFMSAEVILYQGVLRWHCADRHWYALANASEREGCASPVGEEGGEGRRHPVP